METIKRFIHEDEGQNLVEYALLAGLVALVAIVAVGSVGTEIERVYGALQQKLATIKP
jgi:Flp pilus assembly pilin Flp